VPNAHLLVLGVILIGIMFLLPNGLVTLVSKSGERENIVGIKIKRREAVNTP
jgi:hypothetical protein